MEISGLRQQKIWGRAAAINFTFGGSGAAYYVLAVVSLWWFPESMYSPNTLQFTGTAVVLMSVGFLLLAIESGNTYKSLYALFNLRTSWMSREVLLFVLFVSCAVLGVILGSLWVKLAAALAAVLFAISQSLIFFKARAIIAWNTPATPFLFLTSGAVGGFGVFMALHGGVGVGAAALVALSVHLLAYTYFLFVYAQGGRDLNAATVELRRVKSLVFTLLLGSVAPLMLIALAMFLGGGSEARGVYLVAGAAMLLGTYFRNSHLILKAGVFRRMELRLE